MLTEKIRNQMLVDEMQLGDRLNQDVQRADRADFALMLAMLSQDVTDHAEFDPSSEQETTEADLRARFGLPPAVKAYADEADFKRGSAVSQLFNDDGINSVFLAHCLRSEPLVPFEHRLAPEVFAGLPPLKQQKLRLEYAGEKPAYEKLQEKGDGFGVLQEISLKA